MSDAGFCFLGYQVEDCGSCGFAAGAGGGWDGDQGMERFGDGQTTAERGVDEVEEVCLWEACVQVHELGGINDLGKSVLSGLACMSRDNTLPPPTARKASGP